MRVCLYTRVSTARQAEQGLSLPDQRKQLHKFCDDNGHAIIREYCDEGVTGTTDHRPEFQKMISDALKKPSPFEAIVVYDLSRFFRNVELQGTYIRKLKAVGVRLISMTQQFQQGATGDFMTTILGGTNAFYSAQLGERVSGAMIENATRGYANGARPPYGYKTVATAEMGKQGFKKRLAVDPAEAGIVKMVFDLYLHGYKGKSLGVKAISAHLNERGITRRGQKWTRSKVHELLCNRAYIGEHYFNKVNSKLRIQHPKSEWVPVKVEPIVSEDIFYRAEKRRHLSSPKITAPRLVNSDILLSGTIECGNCGAGFSTQHGNGNGGRYRYYKCNTRVSKQNDACDCPNLPMEKFDSLVLQRVSDKVIVPDRVALIMAAVLKSEKNGQSNVNATLGKLKQELNNVNAGINRLTDIVEKAPEVEDEILTRIRSLGIRRREIDREIATLKGQREIPLKIFNPTHLAEATAAIRAKLLDKESGFAKKYLNLIVKVITVKKRVARIEGDNGELVGVIKNAHEGLETVPPIVPSWPTKIKNHLFQDGFLFWSDTRAGLETESAYATE